MLNYPLEYRFKKVSITNKVYVKDAAGSELMFAHQKALKLKENVQIYSDENKSQQLGEINADRVIDFSPTFRFTDTSGQVLSQVKRQGKRSIWRAHYEIQDGQGQARFTVREDNVWAKVIDSLISEIPFAALVMGYFFNVRYNIIDTNGQTVATLAKQPAFIETTFKLEPTAPGTNFDPSTLLPSAVLIVIMRERFRG